MATVKENTVVHTRELREDNKAAATVSTNGEILMLTAGLAVPATSATVAATLLGVCKATIAAADALTRVLYIVPNHQDTYIFPTTNNTLATDNGQQMVLTDSTHVNNTHTTSATGIVQQVEPYGLTTDNLIVGRFVTL